MWLSAGSFATGAGFSRSAVNSDSGATSQMSLLVSGFVAIIIVFAIAPALYFLPKVASVSVLLALVPSTNRYSAPFHPIRSVPFDGLFTLVAAGRPLGDRHCRREQAGRLQSGYAVVEGVQVGLRYHDHHVPLHAAVGRYDGHCSVNLVLTGHLHLFRDHGTHNRAGSVLVRRIKAREGVRSSALGTEEERDEGAWHLRNGRSVAGWRSTSCIICAKIQDTVHDRIALCNVTIQAVRSVQWTIGNSRIAMRRSTGCLGARRRTRGPKARCEGSARCSCCVSRRPSSLPIAGPSAPGIGWHSFASQPEARYHASPESHAHLLRIFLAREAAVRLAEPQNMERKMSPSISLCPQAAARVADAAIKRRLGRALPVESASPRFRRGGVARAVAGAC